MLVLFLNDGALLFISCSFAAQDGLGPWTNYFKAADPSAAGDAEVDEDRAARRAKRRAAMAARRAKRALKHAQKKAKAT